jgi:adenosylcobinamide-phosphate guanylyltransferase
MEIRGAYDFSGKEALSTWVPTTCQEPGVDLPYSVCIGGIVACPAGINIIRGDLIDRPQDEEKLLINDRRLGYNVNTREDLEKARHFLSRSQLRTERHPGTLDD